MALLLKVRRTNYFPFAETNYLILRHVAIQL